MADEIARKRIGDRAPRAAGCEHDEILSRLSPAFLMLLEFVREQKVNQAAGATISQTEKEVKNIE